MMRAAWFAGIALGLAGCGPAVQESVRTYNEDGVYLFQHGEYTGARESFQAALALQPENDGLLFNIGECYDRQGQTAKAEEFYNKCLQKESGHARCRHALAALLVRTGRRKEATRMIEAWLAKESKKADAYAEDGWLWHKGGDLPQAQARLQQALDIDPHNVRALTEMGLVYEELGMPDRAVVVYERSLDQDPSQPEVKQRLNALLVRGTGRPKPGG
jgi:Tfp pilus assembly protein PilF